MNTKSSPWGLYLYNGAIRPIAHDLKRVISHLMIVQGKVVHASEEEAPMGLDYRHADFGKTRQRLAQQIQFVDLDGATVLPGLCDAHVHFLWWSDTLDEIDLSGTTSLEQALEKVRLSASRVVGADAQHTWLSGHGWSHNAWGQGTLPTAGQLDSVTGNIPTFLSSKCGHLAWLNSAALARCGIAGASDPDGGHIVRDLLGDPTGILEERAMRLAESHLPVRTRDVQRKSFLKGQAEAHSFGITSMHTPESVDHFARYQQYRASGELKMRIQFLMPAAQLGAMKELAVTRGLGDDWLRISGTKLFADGSLGGRTASMYDPYCGEADNYGIIVSDAEEILKTSQASQALGIPMVIHAIGDRAVGDVLRAYQECHGEREAEGWERLPHRIEHLQVIHPRDLDLLKEVTPVASVQPIHLCADIPSILRYWGPERGRLAYAFKTIQEAGCPLIFGSDAPVEPISPWLGLYGAITRQEIAGGHGEGFHQNQNLTVADCMMAYSSGPARAVDQWPKLGCLLPGAWADFAIFSTDPLQESPRQWLETRAKATYVEGRCVWSQNQQNESREL